MKSLLVFCLLLISLSGLFAERRDYTGYTTYRVTPKTNNDLKILDKFSDDPYYDFWSRNRVAGKPIDIMVAPKAQKGFEEELTKNNIFYMVLIENVEEVIENERMRQEVGQRFDDNTRISFNRYYRYSEIQDYLAELEAVYPNLVSVQSIGNTYEGRSLDLITISSGGGGSRPAIFIDAGIHAREWAASSTVLYLINQLVENYENNRDLVDQVDWYIVPVANPDGYEYTHTTDRFWRKTRSRGTSSCYGADPNRNYGFHWGEAGASSSPCSETYRGARAFSEIETANMRDFELAHADQIKAYLAIHTYGQYFLYPWGYTWDLPEDWRDLDALANDAADAIASYRGTRFEVGSSTQVLYEASGGSDDYAKGTVGVKYAYTIELVGGGSAGFDLPASQILNAARETFEGFRVVAEKVATLR